MMHLPSRFFWSAAVALLLLSGCSGNKAPELVAVEIADLSREAGEGNLLVNLQFHNPNKGALTIRKAPVSAKINQKSLGVFELAEPRVLAGKSTDTLALQYAFTPDDIYPGFLSYQFGAVSSKRVQITLSGKMLLKRENGKSDKEIEVPIDYSEVYKLPN